MKKRVLSSTLLSICALSIPAHADGEGDWSVARYWDEAILDAIRIATPRPPVHARNLYYNSAAMYDAWAAYDPVARGVFFTEKHTARDVEAARHEAISYASYRVLKARFVAGNGPNVATIQANLDAAFAALGYNSSVTTTVGNSPAAIGNRVAAAALAAGLADNSNEPANYAPNNGYAPINEPLVFKIPGCVTVNASRWQPLAFDFLVLQNGIIIGSSIQAFVCPHWGAVKPFALWELDRDPSSGIFLDQGGPPIVGTPWMIENALDNIEKGAKLDPREGEVIDIGLNVYHNSPLGTYVHEGYPVNPVTGQPYESNPVKIADFYRAIVELWADGPDSETPPGHWHVIANEVSDHPDFEHRIAGEGPVVDRLEWDVKLYLAMGGANHDAAVTAWGMKGYYDSARPTTFIRHLAGLGQSSDPQGLNYHPDGLPLIPGLIEQVLPEDVAPGGRFEDFVDLVYEPLSGEPIGINDHVGELVSKAWLGGLYAGTTSGVQVTGPLEGHIYRGASNWVAGDFDLGVDDTPGALNPGQRGTPGSLQINEIRLDQPGLDYDEYFELAGAPGTSLDSVWYVVLGDDIKTAVPDSQGRVLAAISLSGQSLDANGLLLVAKPNFTLGTADLTASFNFEQIGNTTHLLVTDFSGYLGLECDYFDDGVLDFQPWTSVIDSVSLRRNSNAAGVYSNTVIAPADSREALFGVDWQLIDRWMTFMPSNFVTPPFAGYTSGHSTFSRSAAEVLAQFTGSPYYPGGYAELVLEPGDFKFEKGPSEPLTLQWATYYDSADEAGLSRLTSGIHPIADDLPGRITGSWVGKRSFARAMALFSGLSASPDLNLDGVVDGADLAIFLDLWGTSDAAADFNGDGTVDGNDIGLLLASWG